MNNSSINNIINSNKVRDKIIVAGFIFKKYAIRIPGQGWSIDIETCLKTKEGETFEQKCKRIIEQDIYKSSDFVLAKDIYNIKDETKEYKEKHTVYLTVTYTGNTLSEGVTQTNGKFTLTYTQSAERAANAQIPEGTTRTVYSSSPYYHFDSEGYIDEIIIVSYAGRV